MSMKASVLLKSYFRIYLFILLIVIALIWASYLWLSVAGPLLILLLITTSGAIAFVFCRTYFTFGWKTFCSEGQNPYISRQTIKKIAAQYQISPPTFYIVTKPDNITSLFGIYEPCVFISKNLLENLTAAEIEALFHLFFARIAAKRTIAYTVTFALLYAMFSITKKIDFVISWTLSTHTIKGSSMSQPLFSFILPLFFYISKIYFNKSEELEADTLASKHCDINVLANTLWKINCYSKRTPPLLEPNALIGTLTTPFDSKKKSIYLNYQISIAKRIANLGKSFPL